MPQRAQPHAAARTWTATPCHCGHEVNCGYQNYAKITLSQVERSCIRHDCPSKPAHSPHHPNEPPTHHEATIVSGPQRRSSPAIEHKHIRHPEPGVASLPPEHRREPWSVNSYPIPRQRHPLHQGDCTRLSVSALTPADFSVDRCHHQDRIPTAVRKYPLIFWVPMLIGGTGDMPARATRAHWRHAHPPAEQRNDS